MRAKERGAKSIRKRVTDRTLKECIVSRTESDKMQNERGEEERKETKDKGIRR